MSWFNYSNDPKFSDREVWANSADPDQTAPRGLEEQSDQGLHCLLCQIQSFWCKTLGFGPVIPILG